MATPERAAIRLNIRFKFIPLLLSFPVEPHADYKQSQYQQSTYSYTQRSRWLPCLEWLRWLQKQWSQDCRIAHQVSNGRFSRHPTYWQIVKWFVAR